MKYRGILYVLLVTMILTGCSKYDESDLIGKTSSQIVEVYGEFDCIGMSADADGLYRNCRCGYTIRESRTGFLGTEPEVLFYIVFDGDGIAVRCEEGYRIGG